MEPQNTFYTANVFSDASTNSCRKCKGSLRIKWCYWIFQCPGIIVYRVSNAGTIQTLGYRRWTFDTAQHWNDARILRMTRVTYERHHIPNIVEEQQCIGTTNRLKRCLAAILSEASSLLRVKEVGHSEQDQRKELGSREWQKQGRSGTTRTTHRMS
jgi:hypothetical protein